MITKKYILSTLALVSILFFSFPLASFGKEKIPIVYFSTPGCEECEITQNYLETLKEIYPEIDIQEFSLTDNKNKELLAHFDKAYNVPENKKNVAPSVFIGKQFCIS